MHETREQTREKATKGVAGRDEGFCQCSLDAPDRTIKVDGEGARFLRRLNDVIADAVFVCAR